MYIYLYIYIKYFSENVEIHTVESVEFIQWACLKVHTKIVETSPQPSPLG